MPHPFLDKLVVFIGTPTICTRQTARDRLVVVGGVPDDRVTGFANYVVAFGGAEKTKAYEKAYVYDKNGLCALLNEAQFFDILEGNAEPPEMKNSSGMNGVTIIPGKNPEAHAREHEKFIEYLLNRKRLNSMAKHGIPTPDGGRMKIDLRQLDKTSRVIQMMREQDLYSSDKSSEPDSCDKCGNPVKVHLHDGENGKVANLCIDCYNRVMAGMSGTDFRDVPTKRLSFKRQGGKAHEFDIELMVFPKGKLLTATEIGKTKRKVDVLGELDDDVDEMFEILKKRIKKALSATYMQKDGYIAGSKAVGYIEYNDKREAHDIVIDGKPYTWAELEKNISSHEGWKIKIEFGDVGDDLDADK
jgi:hypothetical protein